MSVQARPEAPGAPGYSKAPPGAPGTRQARPGAASAPGGTEPILIFADVFDPAQSQLAGMQRLFEVKDFVAEEWPHLLIWDLFVGRSICHLSPCEPAAA